MGLREREGSECIELKKRDGKTYVVVNDYPRLRELFGTLLAGFNVSRVRVTMRPERILLKDTA